MWKKIAKNIIHMNYDIPFGGCCGLKEFHSKTQLQQRLLYKSVYYHWQALRKNYDFYWSNIEFGLILNMVINLDFTSWSSGSFIGKGHRMGNLWKCLH